MLTPSTLIVLATVVINMTGVGLFWPILPMLVQELGGGTVSQTAALYGAISVVFALMQFIFAPMMGALSDRFGRRPVLLTAVTLGAPLIRVWAGKRPFRQADNAYWGQVLADAEKIALLAAEHHIQIAFEFHSNTLADSAVGAGQLLKELADYGLFSYWQPPVLSSEEENAATLMMLAPWLRHLHVFSWRETGNRVERLPLAARREAWLRYFQLADDLPDNRFALLEFVRDDDPAQLMQDAASLHGFLSVIGNR